MKKTPKFSILIIGKYGDIYEYREATEKRQRSDREATEKRQRSDREATIVVVLLLLGIIFTLLGSTLAYFIWRGNITSISFTVSRAFECSGDVGGPISSNQLAPSSCTNSTYAIQREITINPVINSPGVSIYMDMWLDIDQIDDGLANSENFKYAVTLNPNSCTDDVIATGTFKGKNRVEILNNRPFTYQAGLTQRPDLSMTAYLYIWLDAAEEDPATQNNNFALTLGGQCTQGQYLNLTGGAAMLVGKANSADITTYTAGNTGEMYVFDQPETVQLEATTDYRYIGANPNNYIEFNNETWRIIGVIDGKIKIIKDTPIENIMWDYKKSGVGSSEYDYGSNDWTDSQLMYMLNPNDIDTNVALKVGYTYDGTLVKDANNKIIYQRYCKPTEVSTTTTSYNCTYTYPMWSLNNTALSQVADATYYLGGTYVYENSAADWYQIERSNTKYNNSRSLNWTGKVGLMYSSDYAYTFAYGVDETCYLNTYRCYNSNPSSSWLYNSGYYQWTITPRTDSMSGILYVNADGSIYNDPARSSGQEARPVVYLKPDIQLTGIGTNDENIYRTVYLNGGIM